MSTEFHHFRDVRIIARFQWGEEPNRLISFDVSVNEHSDNTANAAEALALITEMVDGYKE